MGLAVYSLLHFPWVRTPQALPGTLSCGARTFLHARLGSTRSDRLADSRRQHSSGSLATLVFHGVVVQLVARSMGNPCSDTGGLRRRQLATQRVHQRRNIAVLHDDIA
jgi:hypothetical protein